jgi:hypothetical protein
LDNCGDEYCGNIITSAELKEEGDSQVCYEKCKSQKIPETEKNTNHSEKTTTGVLQNLKGSAYYKNLHKGKNAKIKCGIYQLNVVKRATGENQKKKTNKPKSKRISRKK